jgi:hypothetical protein
MEGGRSGGVMCGRLDISKRCDHQEKEEKDKIDLNGMICATNHEISGFDSTRNASERHDHHREGAHTDSEIVGIDNRCTACISHDPNDFEGDLEPSNRVVKGFGGSRTRNVKSGTIRWS